MTLAYWCVLVTALMPIVFAGIAKAGGNRYDNNRPRDWLLGQGGWRQRANWAHQNSLEAFPPFAAAVIIAHQLDAGQTAVNALAVAFVLLRMGYGAAYITDRANLRSLLWLGAMACVIALFVVAA